MKMKFLTISGFALLSACGTSSPTFTPIEAKPFAQVEAAATELADKYGETLLNEEFNEAAELRPDGTANYIGIIGLGPTDVASGDLDPYTYGQLSVVVDFDDSTMTGEASNWHDADSDADDEGFSGSATFDADIDEDTGLFGGEIVGQFGDGDEASPFNADISGGFTGDDSAAIVGSGTGSINLDRGDGREDLGFGVIFAAER